MGKRILITGGAGFIGSHVADELLNHNCEVRVLDCLASQVHGSTPVRPAYLDPEVELISGDVRDKATVLKALEGVEAVFHFAAMVGVGQSMYQVEEYTSVNNLGTATLLQALTLKRRCSSAGPWLSSRKSGPPLPETSSLDSTRPSPGCCLCETHDS
jgi:dTDP-L-rhamnose 4-epimerase